MICGAEAFDWRSFRGQPIFMAIVCAGGIAWKGRLGQYGAATMPVAVYRYAAP
jgi:hypothetical protein